jgi:hypothetical protein
MSPAGSQAEPTPSRAEQRAREKAEWAEHDALIKRLGVLWPNYGCFCGTLEDLRRTVADLERRAERTPPSKRVAARAEAASANEDPQAAARFAVNRAHQRLRDGHDSGPGVPGSESRAQLSSTWARGDAGGEVDD